MTKHGASQRQRLGRLAVSLQIATQLHHLNVACLAEMLLHELQTWHPRTGRLDWLLHGCLTSSLVTVLDCLVQQRGCTMCGLPAWYTPAVAATPASAGLPKPASRLRTMQLRCMLDIQAAGVAECRSGSSS